MSDFLVNKCYNYLDETGENKNLIPFPKLNFLYGLVLEYDLTSSIHKYISKRII